MSSRLIRCFLFGLLALTAPLSGLGQAHDSHQAEKTKREWNWLTEDDKTRLLASIPPKPAPGSAIDRADLQTVLKYQATRTPEDIAEAQDDKNFRLEIISKPLGPGFTRETYPVSFALLEHVRQNESLLNAKLKKQNKRLRPFQEHPEVHALFDVEQYSYPSGHSSGAHILGDILAQLFPRHKDALLACADAVGRSRVVAGVHYPSDVEEGKVLAQALTDALLANPDFQKSLAEAKLEVANRTDVP